MAEDELGGSGRVSVAEDSAAALVRRYRLERPVTEDQVDEVIRKLRLKVMSLPDDFPVREVRQGRFIGLRPDLSAGERLWLKLHALGHYMLHRGDQVLNGDLIVTAKQEAQADKFAGDVLFWGMEGLVYSRTAETLAAWAHVPTHCARRWLELSDGRFADYGLADLREGR
jgi:Zn-dependent peptidase ImmA (M78 family)